MPKAYFTLRQQYFTFPKEIFHFPAGKISLRPSAAIGRSLLYTKSNRWIFPTVAFYLFQSFFQGSAGQGCQIDPVQAVLGGEDEGLG